jgi:hypothetical protein
VRVVAGEHGEDARGPDGVGAVVEGQRDRPGGQGAAGDGAVGFEALDGVAFGDGGRCGVAGCVAGVVTLGAGVGDVPVEAEFGEQHKHGQGEQRPVGPGFAPQDPFSHGSLLLGGAHAGPAAAVLGGRGGAGGDAGRRGRGGAGGRRRG